MKYTRPDKPADFSFLHLREFKEGSPEKVSCVRLGRPPPLGPNDKLQTRSIWLNHNGLKSTENLMIFLESVLEDPNGLLWLDLSFNKLEDIDQQGILLLENLQIVYLHGNLIDDPKELLKLKPLKKLKSLTVHGNPVYSKSDYRPFIISTLTQLESLDFARITPSERAAAYSQQALISARFLPKTGVMVSRSTT